MLNTVLPKIHKEGYRFLAIAIAVTFICLLVSKAIGLVAILLTVWVYYFFRDPDRISIQDDSFLVSPADGLVSNISEVDGPAELSLENKKFTKISIFMNVFNCHVRRIVTEVEVNQSIAQGERIGMIRFGSRVDLYFSNRKLLAKLGQNVVAGESLLAVK
jgi:phosphatidylserine decarboxylase